MAVLLLNLGKLRDIVGGLKVVFLGFCTQNRKSLIAAAPISTDRAEKATVPRDDTAMKLAASLLATGLPMPATSSKPAWAVKPKLLPPVMS
ncbi:MAG: hypothetical protein ABSG68_15590 [Thermoguttaceae bacterium]